MDKRIQKKWKRENRPNKGANTKARLIQINARIRQERESVMSDPGMALLGILAARRGR